MGNDLHPGGLHLMGSASMGVCIQEGWTDPPSRHWIQQDMVNERVAPIILDVIYELFQQLCVTIHLPRVD